VSVTFTEREALRQMIEYYKEERNRLLEEMTKATGRLSELDKLDNVHPEYQPKEGIVEEKETQTEPTSNRMSLEEAIEKHNKLYEPDKEIKPNGNLSLEIDRCKASDKEKNKVTKVPTKRGHYQDVKLISKDIAVILKEAGRPMKTSEIIKKLEEKGIKHKNPYTLLQQAKGYEPKIDKAHFGYYQYKW
jgi:hypothetical protein